MNEYISLMSMVVYLLIGLAYFTRNAELCEKHAPTIWEQAEMLRPALKAALYVLGTMMWPVMLLFDVLDFFKGGGSDAK